MEWKLPIALADDNIIDLEHTSVDILKVLCDMLPVSFKNATAEVLEIDFADHYDKCSSDICFFDQFVYVAVTDHNESVIGYNIVMKNFIPGITNAEALAFGTESYLSNHVKPLKAVAITEKNFIFTLEIKVSSYYSFAIKFNNGSCQEFSFSQIGIHSYYNASNISSWCAIKSNTSTCTYHVAAKDPIHYCFLAHIHEEDFDTDVIFKQIVQHFIYQETQPTTTPFGYSTIIITILIVAFISGSIAQLSFLAIEQGSIRNEEINLWHMTQHSQKFEALTESSIDNKAQTDDEGSYNNNYFLL